MRLRVYQADTTSGSDSARLEAPAISRAGRERLAAPVKTTLRPHDERRATSSARAHLSVDEPPPHASVHRCVYLPPETLRGARELPWIVLRPRRPLRESQGPPPPTSRRESGGTPLGPPPPRLRRRSNLATPSRMPASKEKNALR